MAQQGSDFESDFKQFQEDELVSEVLGELKSGKEATVHLVRLPDDFLAAVKFYRPMEGKGFATSEKYREGRFLRSRDSRALRKRSRYGRQLAQLTWISHEFRMLRRLYRHKLPVPKPLAFRGASILMEFVASRPGSQEPAQRLIDAESLTPAQASSIHQTMMRAVITMMEHHIIHADLSPYNVLLPEIIGDAEPAPMIIDFPQAVDPRQNQNAMDMLIHDIEQMTSFCQRFDASIEDRDLAHRLWSRFARGQI